MFRCQVVIDRDLKTVGVRGSAQLYFLAALLCVDRVVAPASPCNRPSQTNETRHTRASDGVAAAVVLDGHAVAVPGYADVGEILRAGEPAVQLSVPQPKAATGRPTVRRTYGFRFSLPPLCSALASTTARISARWVGSCRTHPTLFSKLARTLADPFAADRASGGLGQDRLRGRAGDRHRPGWPRHQRRGRGGAHRRVPLMNDVSMRDWQYRTLQWFAGKNLERSTPVGPYVVTPDEFTPDSATLELTVNGELRQQAQLTDLRLRRATADRRHFPDHDP